jgi:hypothetical protein
MKLAFILCLIVWIIAIIIYFLFLREKKNLKLNIITAFIACIISNMILIFPFLEYDKLDLKILMSFISSIKCAVMDQDIDFLSNVNLNSLLGHVYFVAVNILFLITPALTVSFIISYLEKLVDHVKFSLSKKKRTIIFSELNDKSLILARDYVNDKKCSIVFANVKEKNDIKIKSIKLLEKVTDIKINSKNEVIFYIISSNEEKNLNEALELIDKYKDRDNTKIYVLDDNEEAPIILDSTDKGKIDVDIINEKERAIFNLLSNKPLFLNAINKTISILIVGCGNIGKEFLKDSVWCSMLPKYNLRILVIDNNADIIKEKINVEMPELLNNYDITFVNEDIKSSKSIEMIRSNKDINYIMVSMENDDKNIETAIMLRRLFLREFDREPIINLYIENDFKQDQVISLSNERGDSYKLNAFGSIDDLYRQNNIVDIELEKLAQQIHLSYDPFDKELKRYNSREYNKRTSRACALHIKYKLFAVLGDKYTEDMNKNLELFRKKYNSKIEQELSKNEHDRWNAYMRSIGYVYVSTDEVKNYYKKTKHHVNYLARMHPALVSYDKLDDVSKELSKITSKNINLKDSDVKIVRLLKTIDL